MRLCKLASVLIAFVLSTNVNAVVINTLNGTQYQWLEFEYTRGLSRQEVELLLEDSSSELFGYQYASRSLMQDLLLSYSSWDGLSGYHGDSDVISGVSNILADFGVTRMNSHGGEFVAQTVDGYEVNYSYYHQSFGMFGEADECGVDYTCFTNTIIKYDANDNATMALQTAWHGYDSVYESPFIKGNSSPTNNYYGSYLVRTSVVPVPAAIWLFCSGVIVLVGFARGSNGSSDQS